MNKSVQIVVFLFLSHFTMGQGSYVPAAGQIGTTAMHKDSSSFVAWATNCSVKRGYQQINDSTLGKASLGDSTDVYGKANGTVVSLGDGGEAILNLYQSLHNGPGPDFAIFENGFNSSFIELAFVEVSSDGIHFFRFPANSETQDSIQIGTFGAVDATNINNLAGKYQVNYGSPFDLDEISNDSLLNKGNITHIKIIDVIGNITPEFANYDSQNRKINDPWPTPFASSGFDLDAVGLIHVNGINTLTEKQQEFKVFPNPFTSLITVNSDVEIEQLELISLSGKTVAISANSSIEINELPSGIYLLRISTEKSVYVKKVVKK
ncbi:T9SS type A sorting domain-containing protein [Flavobacteriales bacterium]|nr:T9SS type A sorting domain-containing protein [Flavobacteriales bacterium]